jgi:hypothetical protein
VGGRIRDKTHNPPTRDGGWWSVGVANNTHTVKMLVAGVAANDVAGALARHVAVPEDEK